MTKPGISVIIPCYNYARFLPEAVKSVVNQTSKDWEIIIVNDASTDNTAEAAGNLIKKYKKQKIRLLNRDKNSGPGEARNAGIAEASGKYIFPLDADDLLHRDCLKKMREVIEKGSYDIIYSEVKYFDKKNSLMKDVQPFSYDLFRQGNIISVMALFRKQDWVKTGGFKTFPLGLEDYEFWIRMIRAEAKPFQIPQVLCYYRQHNNNIVSGKAGKAGEVALKAILKDHIDWCLEIPAYFRIANYYHYAMEFKKAELFYKKILEIDPCHYFTLYNMGSMYEEKKIYDKAIEYFIWAEKNSFGYTGDLSGLYFHLGRIYLNEKNIPEAKKYFKKCLQSNNKHVLARQFLVSLSKRQNSKTG